jgi:hypothetical protein
MDALADELELALARSSPSPRRIGISSPLAPPVPVRPVSEPSWRFRRVAAPRSGQPLRALAFSPNGERLVAVGERELSVFDGAWHVLAAPSWLRAAAVRCVSVSDDGRIVAGGDAGLVAQLDPDGDYQRWAIELPPGLERPCFDGLEARPGGEITFVGKAESARGPVGLIARVRPEGIETETSPAPLTCVASLEADRLLVAGPGVIRCVAGRRYNGIEGAPYAIFRAAQSLGARAYVVGTGGFAISTDGKTCTLERVETTSTLEAVAVRGREDGGMWAASDKGRFLRRDPTGTWKRVACDLGGAYPHFRAIVAGPGRVRAAAADGSVFEGMVD